MKKSNMHKFHMDICGNKWSIFIKNDDQYAHLTKDEPDLKNSRALTFTRTKQIYFNCSDYYVGDQVARHELVHAFAAEMLHHDLPKNDRDTEEFFCTLIEYRAGEILEKASVITKKLAKYHKLCKAKNKGHTQGDVIDD